MRAEFVKKGFAPISFKFNPKQAAHTIQLSMGNLKATKISDDCNNYGVRGNETLIDKGIGHNMFMVDVLLHSDNHSNSKINIGMVAIKYDEKDVRSKYMLLNCANGKLLSYTKTQKNGNSQVTQNSYLSSKIEGGSLITILLDMRERTIGFCINAQYYGQAFQIDDKDVDDLFFCVSLENQNDSVELLKLPDMNFAEEKMGLKYKMDKIEKRFTECYNSEQNLLKVNKELKSMNKNEAKNNQ